MALQIGVELQSLTDSFANDFYRWCEFDFDVHVTTGTDAHNICGDAVIGSSMILVNAGKVQNVSFVDRSIEKARGLHLECNSVETYIIYRVATLTKMVNYL